MYFQKKISIKINADYSICGNKLFLQMHLINLSDGTFIHSIGKVCF